MTVIYDEAELAAQREGWDAARWVRHLAAKLNRGGDVLPPGAESEPVLEGPDHVEGARNLYQYRELDEPAAAPFAGLSLDDNAIAHDVDDAHALGIGDLAREFAALSAKDAPPASQTFDGTADSAHTFELPELDVGMLDTATSITLDPVLVEAETATQAPEATAADHRFRRDLDEIHARIASLELVDAPRTIAKVTGAVLVLAGIGGPDAVRQLLGGLPKDFPRPVLIQQRLDGARHDKLVRQMQRATEMPVLLAAPAVPVEPGHVYILPEQLGLAMRDGALAFDATADALSNLPAGDSAVIVLSGTDPAVADAVMTLSWGGALVAGQMPEGCYDAAAAEAIIARGADKDTPVAIAQRLAQRWPA